MGTCLVLGQRQSLDMVLCLEEGPPLALAPVLVSPGLVLALLLIVRPGHAAAVGPQAAVVEDDVEAGVVGQRVHEGLHLLSSKRQHGLISMQYQQRQQQRRQHHHQPNPITTTTTASITDPDDAPHPPIS